ncbi:Uncharacterised protein [uncultured archaeon]|nr:Uncharacterised protein [uncultured archaeon]
MFNTGKLFRKCSSCDGKGWKYKPAYVQLVKLLGSPAKKRCEVCSGLGTI